MSDRSPDPRRQLTERILELLRQLPPEVVEALIERWLWELDDLWRKEGIPEDIEEKIDEARKRFDKTEDDVDDMD
ncbi:hypothetical protein HC928_08170 [bacterium]|jgi:hypothetical protein|nr:hypothetical protein [bacterium]